MNALVSDLPAIPSPLARPLQYPGATKEADMANKNLFASTTGRMLQRTNAVNEETAPAYALSARHALAQYAATGCLSATFYASAEEQLDRVLGFCEELEPEFIARTAVYARQAGGMKDLPALLCAVLSTRNPEMLKLVFDRVVDNGRMLRTFVQIVRSGAAGRTSLGTVPKRLVLRWLEARSDEQLFNASVGNDPSLADVVKMVHPKPGTRSRAALYGYLIGRAHRREDLPAAVRAFEDFKAGAADGAAPDVPFQMLTALELSTEHWRDIARRASWQMTRMNLNTFARHGVYDGGELDQIIAARLCDRSAIAAAGVFPYQLLVAWAMAEPRVPACVRDALQEAMEIAVGNVPAIDGQVFVCPDVSGSMSSPITGHRAGATTAARCIDVAALVAATVLRRNPLAEVIPFEQKVVNLQLNGRDSIMTNAARLASIGGGGTSCSAPLALLNRRSARGDLVILVSDNESWVDARAGRGTELMRQWQVFRARNPRARLVCIDVQPYATTQAVERADILNIGGFSDRVFEVVGRFADGTLEADHWVGVIEAIEL
jgi:60 kDa SS-A/Ro ribonucleoprotein